MTPRSCALPLLLLFLPSCKSGYLFVTARDRDSGTQDDSGEDDTADDTGSSSQGDLSVPAEIDFGWVLLGNSETDLAEITNTGEEPVEVLGFELAAGPDIPFLLITDTHEGEPITLAPGDVFTLIVEYQPTQETCSSSLLTIHSDDPDEPSLVLSMTGCGTEGVGTTLLINVDDAWEAWLDGAPFTATHYDDYTRLDTVNWELLPGEHTIAVEATDTARPAGLIAGLFAEGESLSLTGDGSLLAVDSEPPEGWDQADYDDSSWDEAPICEDPIWGPSLSGTLTDDGAQWIWSKRDFEGSGGEMGWFRVHFTVPAPAWFKQGA